MPANTGRWKRGQSGNPKGRPQGSRPTVLTDCDEAIRARLPGLIAKLLDEAEAGDRDAAAILLRKVYPDAKSRPVQIDLPAMQTIADVVAGMGRVIEALNTGAIAATEAEAMLAVVEYGRRLVETADLAERVARLEQAGHEGRDGDHG